MLKPKTRKLLTIFKIIGDIFLALVGISLIADGDLDIGAIVLTVVAINLYLAFDYIKDLNHKIRYEQDLELENRYEGYVKNKIENLPGQKVEEEEEDISSLLQQNSNKNEQMHG